MSQTGKLVVISGPSGVGKSSLLAGVMKRVEAEFSVSATTRKPRAGEQDGQAYRFVDRQTFERMIAGDELLEWAEVFGRYYGTPAAPVREALAAGRTILLDIDVQGAFQVHEKMPDATFVLILPPDEAELARRLKGRGSEDEQELAQRLAKAEDEISAARESGIYKHVVVNDELDRAISQVAEIVAG